MRSKIIVSSVQMGIRDLEIRTTIWNMELLIHKPAACIRFN